jgi:formate-dependent nitrite reductase membrane component NrfD
VDLTLQTDWGWEIALYLFFGGLSAGILCISAIINLVTGDKYQKTIRFGAWSGTIILILGVFLLLLDAGVPTRAIILFQSFINFDSWMAFGAWFLFAGIAIFGIYALANTGCITGKLKFLLSWKKVLAIIIIPISLGIAIYTGILLGVLYAHPLWNTWLLPALFTISALDTGVAYVLGHLTLYESETIEGLAQMKKRFELSTIALIVLESIILTTYLTTVASSGSAASASVDILTSGVLSVFFWAFLVGGGLAVPLLVSVILVIRHQLAKKTLNILPMLGVSLCLVGGFTLRYIILMAGLPLYV